MLLVILFLSLLSTIYYYSTGKMNKQVFNKCLSCTMKSALGPSIKPVSKVYLQKKKKSISQYVFFYRGILGREKSIK